MDPGFGAAGRFVRPLHVGRMKNPIEYYTIYILQSQAYKDRKRRRFCPLAVAPADSLGNIILTPGGSVTNTYTVMDEWNKSNDNRQMFQLERPKQSN